MINVEKKLISEIKNAKDFENLKEILGVNLGDKIYELINLKDKKLSDVQPQDNNCDTVEQANDDLLRRFGFSEQNVSGFGMPKIVTSKDKLIGAFEDYFNSKSQSLLESKQREMMKEILDFVTHEKSQYAIMYGNQEKRFATNDSEFNIDELIDIFLLSKHQQ